MSDVQDARVSAGQFPPGQAPRLSLEDIKGTIIRVEFINRGKYMICLLTLKNGMIVSGESSCVYPENYSEEKGKEVAYKMAEGKVWSLEGYLLAQRRHEDLIRFSGE